MDAPVLLCTDGSDLAAEALRAGLDLLHPDAPRIVVSVSLEPDPTLLTGTGMAGGVLSPEAFQQAVDAADAEALTVATETAADLGLADAVVAVLRGDPAATICQHAEQVGAGAIVIGTRGRGGLKRAVLGSVSDHVIRHAPCPVVVVTAHGADHEPG
jgi:nucleotide-binding universal stress UspA family protein